MEADDLTAVDKAILDALQANRSGEGPWGIATKGQLVDETEYSENSIYTRLETLVAGGCVEVIHEGTRVFRFVTDPRNE